MPSNVRETVRRAPLVLALVLAACGTESIIVTPTEPPALPAPPQATPPDTATPPPPPPPPPPPGATGDLVVYPTEEIAFILGPQLKAQSASNPWPWYDLNQVNRGLRHGAAFPEDPSLASNHNEYILSNYYDLGLTLYLAYYRTGNPLFQSYARKVADSWWKRGNIGQGQTRSWGQTDAPRNVALGGLMLRAMDGRPEMWDWIVGYSRYQYKIWLGDRLKRGKLWYGVRDGGYALLYAAWLARAHPDAAVRAEFHDKAIAAARDYYARLQYADGGWYWAGSPGDSDAPDGDQLFGQPFTIGLLLEALISVHQLTDDPAVAQSILKACDWLYEKAYRPAPFRGMWYFIFEDGKHRGARDEKDVREVRQLNATTVHAFGYAYRLSGDARYLQWGDEIFASTFGKGQGPGADERWGLADYREKEYNESYRSSGRYLAWRASPR